MKEPASTSIAGSAQGRVVGELAELKVKAPEWALVALVDLTSSLAAEALPREADPLIASQVVALAAELVAGAYGDASKWREPPEDGWPRGAGRRRRLGAIAETLAHSAALTLPDLDTLPAPLRHRALHLSRAAVVLLARHDPQVGSRLIAPERARAVLERATNAARSAHEMGAK